MARNIVTGATGFLGGSLARKLKGQGETVLGIGRDEEKGKELEKEGIRFIALDLADRDRTVKLLKDAEYVFHCSAHSDDQGAYKTFFDSNVLATKNVISACFMNGPKRLVYVSTPSIYTEDQHRIGLTEKDPFATRQMNAYTKTKLLAERCIDEAFENGLDVVTLRPRGIIGRHDEKLLRRIVEANAKGLPIIDGGEALMDLTHIDNVVEALILAREWGTPGGHYNLSNGEPEKFIDLAKYLFHELGVELRPRNLSFRQAYALASGMEIAGKMLGMKNVPLTRYAVCLLGRSQTFDIGLAREELGYRPGKSVREGIEEWTHDYREHHHREALLRE
jgi:nucleoside-diphosphate-sugar epimerase